MEHAFGTDGHGSFSLGVEEELMFVDRGTLALENAIDRLLGDVAEGSVQPELMESVLEVATGPCGEIADVDRQLRALRGEVRERAARHGLAIASAGTHPTARWEDQRIVGATRYRGLVDALRHVARQELIFGMHVHVAVDDPDVAVHVANGMRTHCAVLLALSANSPYWRGDETGLQSTRTPLFRAFPRVGIPPAYRDWEDYVEQIDFMVRSGVMEDYTYLWYDVRPHPRLGTVEVRVCDAQTRVEHTLGLSALIQAMVRELALEAAAGRPPAEPLWQMLDENKWLAARHGLRGELVDLPSADRVRTTDLARRLLDRLREHAQDLGGADALAAVEDLLERGNGAERQVVVFEANRDFGELLGEIVAATAPEPASSGPPYHPPP